VAGVFGHFRRKHWGRHPRTFWFESFYQDPKAHYQATLASTLLFVTLVLTGMLLFRYSDSGDLLIRGQRLLKEGKAALALQTLHTLVAQQPNHYQAHLHNGSLSWPPPSDCSNPGGEVALKTWKLKSH
jgi:hypothetical protein